MNFLKKAKDKVKGKVGSSSKDEADATAKTKHTPVAGATAGVMLHATEFPSSRSYGHASQSVRDRRA